MQLLDIAEVAKRSGVPASTLRFYEEKGLIAPVGRRGLRRLFEPNVLARLALIALGQTAGFSLAEISQMLLPAGGASIDRDLLSAKADEMERMIQRLAAIRDGLRHAAACPAGDHLECPSFRRALGLAASGTLPRLLSSPSPRSRRG